jgi:hypothetical protein
MIRIRLFGTVRRCCAIAALALLADGAFAQPPQEMAPSVEDTIKLQPGESRTFRFDESMKQIATPVENVVEVTPQSDRIFTFKGIAPGETIVTARSDDGRVTRRMLVVVGGHLVKVYRPDVEDSTNFVCDELSCDPANSNRPKPSSQSLTVRRATGGGSFVETTKNYP